MVIHWPQGIKGQRRPAQPVLARHRHRSTILEAAGLPEPKSVNGTVQTPIEGTSLVYAFNDGKAPERHKTQYFEMFGNRGIYSDGWMARTIHRAPWQTSACSR
jgi:arylsulfatase